MKYCKYNQLGIAPILIVIASAATLFTGGTLFARNKQKIETKVQNTFSNIIMVQEQKKLEVEKLEEPLKQAEENSQEPERETEEPYEINSISLSQEEVNQVLSTDILQNETLEGISLKNASVDLENNLIKITVYTSEGDKIYAEVSPTDNGTNIELKKLNLAQDGIFAGIKEKLISQAIKTYFPEMIQKFEPNFHHFEVSKGRVSVYLKG